MDHDKLELNEAKINYKRNFYRRLWRGNINIQISDYIYLDVWDRNKKDKLGGHTDGPFLILERTTRTSSIQRGDVWERVNIDRVGLLPTLDTNSSPSDALEMTFEDLVSKHR